MKWKYERTAWMKHGNCWTWWKINKSVYYSGNQVWFVWGRIAIIFERIEWLNEQ